MNRTVVLILGGAAALAVTLAVAVVGTGVATAIGGLAGDSNGDQPITGAALDRAVAAALAQVGPGTVTDSEVGDDGAAYSVEIRLEDGRQVEVNLDADFAVLSREADDDSDRTP